MRSLDSQQGTPTHLKILLHLDGNVQKQTSLRVSTLSLIKTGSHLLESGQHQLKLM